MGDELQQQQVTVESAGATTETAPESKAGEQAHAQFTQADVNRIIAERLQRAEASATEKLVKDLGVDSLSELKRFFEEARAKREAEMTEIEKANAALEAERKRRAAAEEQLQLAHAAQMAERRNRAIERVATNAHNTADVIRWAETDGKALLDKVIAESGAIDDKAAQALVEACKKQMPHYFKTAGPGSPSNFGGIVPSTDEQAISRLRKERGGSLVKF